MPPLGAHMSIAGGYHKAVTSAAELGMDCVQIFTKNNNQWRAKPLTDRDISQFRETLEETGIGQPCAHSSYLINLASSKPELWQKSVDALVVELQRAEALGLLGVVVHPGSYVDSTEEEGLRRIVEGLDAVCQRTEDLAVEIWLECTAGQGTSLGHRLEHLQFLLDEVAAGDRFGVCLDTCHLLAAGYPIHARQGYDDTLRQIEELIGLERLRAVHLNDSKRPLGSRVDRHEHIGEGCLGEQPFACLLNDPRLQHIPMYMETPKGTTAGESWDSINLARLRQLQKRKPPSR